MDWNEFLKDLILVFITLIVAYLFYRCECRHQKAKSQIKQLAQEVSAYWCLEKLSSEELAKRDNKTQRIVMRDYRQKAQQHENNIQQYYPSMTAKKADKIFNNYL